MGALIVAMFLVCIMGMFIDWIGIVLIMIPIVTPSQQHPALILFGLR